MADPNNPGDGGTSAAPQELDTSPQGDDIETTGAETEGEDAEGTTEPELDEVDYEGKKYKLPKELKDAVLRQSDYTQKTQALAKERETFVGEREQQTKFFNENRAELGQLFALKNRVDDWEKAFKDPKWAEFEIANAAQAQSLFRQYLMDKDTLAKSAGEFQQKAETRSRTAAAEAAKQVEESHAAVAREIKDWNPQTFDKVKSFASSTFGLKPADLAAAEADPRFLKVLHRAFVGDQAIKKLAAREKAVVAEDAKPLPQLGSNAGANRARTTDSSGDKLSTAEWFKRENERMAKQRTANRKG